MNKKGGGGWFNIVWLGWVEGNRIVKLFKDRDECYMNKLERCFPWVFRILLSAKEMVAGMAFPVVGYSRH